MVHHDAKAVRISELRRAASLKLLDGDRSRDVVADNHVDVAFYDLARENLAPYVLAENLFGDGLLFVLHKFPFCGYRAFLKFSDFSEKWIKKRLRLKFECCKYEFGLDKIS